MYNEGVSGTLHAKRFTADFVKETRNEEALDGMQGQALYVWKPFVLQNIEHFRVGVLKRVLAHAL